MSVRYPKAPCGCTVELYDLAGIKPVVRFDCDEGQQINNRVSRELNMNGALKPALVEAHNEHGKAAIEAVTQC